MPQNHRRVAFSGKAKKEQLKLKRSKKESIDPTKRFLYTSANEPKEDALNQSMKINVQNSKGKKSHRNKYALQFYRETDAEISQKKKLARQALTLAQEESLEIDPDYYFPKELEFPKRPQWCFEESLEVLNYRENRYFTEYVQNIQKQFETSELSYFELNLETWRQLWRVLEFSDIILVIVDIRFAGLMFPPSLYEFVILNLKKEIILVLNKIDLVLPELVAAWKTYFSTKYPKLHIVMFTSVPDYNLVGTKINKKGLNIRKRKGKIRMASEGTQLLLNACKKIVGNAIDLTSWQEKIQEEIDIDDDIYNFEVEEIIEVAKVDTSYFQHEKYKNDVLTIGCIGQPNVGKSSLINAIMGKKVVSVSKTPGHTKHFQTIFLTKNVRLCDCPGLVFPSKVPKVLQVLMGSFPIAQLREPFTTIKYLAEHLNLTYLLGINHPDGDEEWSAMDICDGWAKKRNFLTAKAARLDAYRAANNLLRMALDGKICLCLKPPGYIEKKEIWITDADVKIVQQIQGQSFLENASLAGKNIEDSEEDELNTIDSDPSSENSDDSDSNIEEISVVSNKFSLLKNC